MGDELCCSKQQEMDNQNLNKPETILTSNNNNSRMNKLNYYNMKNIEDYEKNQEDYKEFNYKNLKMQKNQLMYVKRNIQQKYNFGNYHKNKTNKNYEKVDTNNFSLETKYKQKNGVNINNNINENFSYNKTIINGVNDEINTRSKIGMINNNNSYKSGNLIFGNNINNETNLNTENNNNVFQISYHKNNIANNNEGNQYMNNNEINNKQEEIIPNQQINENNNKIIEGNKLENYSTKKILKNENKNNLQLSPEFISNNNPTQQFNNDLNNKNQNDNNEIYSPIKSFNNYNNEIQTSNIQNNNPSNINITQNVTFGPLKNNSSNILLNKGKKFKEDLNNINNINNNNLTNSQAKFYDNIFESIHSKITNDESEINKIFEMVDNSRNNMQNLKDPVLSDEEVDEIIKKSEGKKCYQYIPKKQNTKTTKTIDYGLYSQNKLYNNQNIGQNENYVPYTSNNQLKGKRKYFVINNNNYQKNGIPTAEQRANFRPMTPDYQIRKNKNNNINNYQNIPIIPKNYQYNNYTPIKSNIPQNSNKYQSPPRVLKANKKNYYPLTPVDRQPAREIYIQSPTKINPPIVTYSTKVIQAPPITYSKLKNFDYYTQQQIPVNNAQKPPNVYQHKTIPNYNNVNNNIHTIQNSSKNSIINHSYLNQIQKLNQTNAPKPNNNLITYITSNYLPNYNNNNLHLSISSSLSGLSKTPRKKDKYGNPIYITSPNSTPERKKKYKDLKKSLASPYTSDSESNDDLSAPQQRRRNKFDDYYNYKASLYGSQFSTPRKNGRINNNFDQFKNKSYDYNNLRRNRLNNNPNNITQSRVSASYFEKNTNISNKGIIESTQEPTGLALEDHTKSIINKYKFSDMSNPSTFHKGNYNLFYFNSPEFFMIPQSEIIGKKKLIYHINNNPSQQAFYEGEVNKFNQRHGLGTIKEPNCTKIGQWRNNQFSGWGRVIKNNGQVFEGKFNNHILSGKGIYKFKDVLYVGTFENGIRQGKGVLITDNFKYEGQFNGGKIDGYGKIVFLGSNVLECEYEGTFRQNNIEGNGIMKWKNGNMYQGEIKNGKMNGRGRFIPKDGIPIDGVFKDNVKVNT